MALASADGQKTKDKSTSVTPASDSDPVPVNSPDHSTDTGFTLAVHAGGIGGAALATDAAPSVLGDVAAARVLRVTAKRDGLMTMGGTVLRMVVADGTSLVVRPWFYDNTQLKWIPHGANVTLTAATTNTGSVTIGNLAGAKMYVQIVTNTGNVSWLGYDVV